MEMTKAHELTDLRRMPLMSPSPRAGKMEPIMAGIMAVTAGATAVAGGEKGEGGGGDEERGG